MLRAQTYFSSMQTIYFFYYYYYDYYFYSPSQWIIIRGKIASHAKKSERWKKLLELMASADITKLK